MASATFGFTHRHRRRGREKLVELRLRQKEYAHDSLRLTYLVPPHSNLRFAKGLPAEVRYGWSAADMQTVHGYVHHTQTEDHIGELRLLHVYVVSCSYRLNEVGTRSYVNKTLAQIASDVAKRNKFSLSIGSDRHHAITHVSQSGKSDFSLLTDQAKAHGYVFYARNTDLVLMPRRVTNGGGRTPTFRFNRTVFRARGAVTEFSHVMLENTDNHDQISMGVSFSGRKVRALRGDRPKPRKTSSSSTRSRATVAHTQAPSAVRRQAGRRKSKAVVRHLAPRPPFHRVDRTVVRNLNEARHAAQAKADMLRFTVTAIANTSGDPRVRQASTVRMVGLGAENDGLWYVTQVDHVVDLVKQQYYMELELARDSLGTTLDDNDVVTPDGRVVAVEDFNVPLTSDGVDSAPETMYEPAAHCAPLDDPTPFLAKGGHAIQRDAGGWTWVWRAKRFKLRRVA